jgi:hypothetical protein
MLRKFMHASFNYILAILCLTLCAMFAVQAVIYHTNHIIGRSIVGYFFAVLLFVTAKASFNRGIRQYSIY